MKKLKLVLFFGLVTSVGLFSQEMGLYWYLSNNWGLDFNTCNGEPVVSKNFPPNYPRNMQVGPENAVVTDSVGNILFTTDGFLVWDKMGNVVDDTLVPVTSNLFSWDNFYDIYPVVLVPFWEQWRKNYFSLYWPVDPTMCRVFQSPFDRNKYFIFTVSRWKYDYNNRIFRWDGIPGYRFFYSVVELNPVNGNIKISSKGNLLFDKNYGVTAFEFIPHKNGRDLWLVLSGSIIDSLEDTPERPLYYIDTFRVFLITFPKADSLNIELKSFHRTTFKNDVHFAPTDYFMKQIGSNKLFWIYPQLTITDSFKVKGYGGIGSLDVPPTEMYNDWLFHYWNAIFYESQKYINQGRFWTNTKSGRDSIPILETKSADFDNLNGAIGNVGSSKFPVILSRFEMGSSPRHSEFYNRLTFLGFSPDASYIYFLSSGERCTGLVPVGIVTHPHNQDLFTADTIYQYKVESLRPFVISNNPNRIPLPLKELKDSFTDTNLIPHLIIPTALGYDYQGSIYLFAYVGEMKQKGYCKADSSVIHYGCVNRHTYLFKINNANDTNINIGFFLFPDTTFNRIQYSQKTGFGMAAWRFHSSYPQIKYHSLTYEKPLCLYGNLRLRLSPFVPFDVRESIERLEWSGPNGFYSEEPEPTIPSFTPEKEGWYRLKIYSPIDTLFDSIYVKIREKTMRINGSKIKKCPNETIVLRVSGGTDYQWSTGESGDSILVTEPGWYVARGYDSCGCLNIDSVLVVDKEIKLDYTNMIDLGAIYLNDSRDTTLTFVNKSGFGIKIQKIEFESKDDAISIATLPVDVEMNPNDSLQLLVNFKPNLLGIHRTTMKIIISEPCPKEFLIDITGVGKSKIALFVTDTTLNIGEQVCLPLKIEGKKGVPISEKLSWNANVSFDVGLLEVSQGIVKNGKRIIELSGEIQGISQAANVLGRICGKVLLPSKQIERVNIDSAYFGDFVEIEKLDGEVLVVGICEPELSRVESFQPVELELVPNPAENELEVRIKGEPDYMYILRFSTLEGREILREEGKLTSN
jgi:hypothetical protein